MYRFQLIDARESNNFQKFKNYVRRTIMKPNDMPVIFAEYDATEMDTWLEKDVPSIMIYRFNKLGENDVATLDYYKNHKDTEKDRKWIYAAISLNIVYLFFYHFFSSILWLNTIAAIIVIGLFMFVSWKKPTISLLNNHLVNTTNSQIADNIKKKD